MFNIMLGASGVDWQIDASSWQFITMAVTLGVILLAGIFLRKHKFFYKIAIGGVSLVALIVSIVSLYLDIQENKLEYGEYGYVDYQTYFFIGMILIAVGMLVYVFVKDIAKKNPTVKLSMRIGITLFVLAGLGMFVASLVYINQNLAVYDGEIFDGFGVGSQFLITAVVFIIVLVMMGVAIFKRKDERHDETLAIVYGAVCIALSFALSYVRIFKLPAGGSVTIASLLPLSLYAYMFGVRRGLMAGLIYGVLQIIQDPWIVHPAQVMTDYIIAFGGFGLVGVFKFMKNRTVGFGLGIVVASIIRYFSHFIGGAIFFGVSGSGEGGDPWAYSAIYNSFVFVDIAIVLVAGMLIMSASNFRKVTIDVERRYAML